LRLRLKTTDLHRRMRWRRGFIELRMKLLDDVLSLCGQYHLPLPSISS
jgi:hypothetical protein